MSLDGANRRHRNALGTTDVDRTYRRKHLNLVPKMYQADLSKNQKIENIKKQGGRVVCDPKDLEYVTTTFLHGRQPEDGRQYTLGGKMGIKMFQDGTGSWILQK